MVTSAAPKVPPSTVAAVPRPQGPGAGPENTSLDEERREVLASVLGTLAGNPSDPAPEAPHVITEAPWLKAPAGRPGRHAA